MTFDEAEEEKVLFRAKPNPVLYALEATRFGFVLLAFLFAYLPMGYVKGWPMRFATLMMLFWYFISNIVLFLGTVIIAYCLTFIVTNKRVIARVSFFGDPLDKVSVAIGSVTRIETNSYNATCGSVYLRSSKALSHEDSKCAELMSGPSTAKGSGNRTGAVIPIKKVGSIWLSMPLSSPPLYGFYGFERFEEFATLISEQRNGQ